MTFKVSIIIPAYNAAKTLPTSINSVLEQTLREWEVIIVNDGSTDDTAAIGAQFSAQDSRIKVFTQANQGVSTARNAGIENAQSEWLLFLDADDWIASEFLEQMSQVLAQDPSLDLIHCQWSWISEDGTRHDYPLVNLKDMFPLTACGCPLAMHGCIIRKSTVKAVGGFDHTLRTCEDWDLWQKVARMGIHTSGIPKVMAFYRMRAGSLSNHGRQMLEDGLRVIERGHSPDPRVSKPLPIYSQGMPRNNYAELRLSYVASTAALLMGLGEDARFMLDTINEAQAPNLDAHEIAHGIMEALILPTCQSRKDTYTLWGKVGSIVQLFLEQLEVKANVPNFTHLTLFHLQKIILEQADIPCPLAFGSYYAVELETTQPIQDINPPAGTTRLLGRVGVEGNRLGVIELPICDGVVSAWVLVDAIATQFFWPILGHYFQQTVYHTLPDIQHKSLGDLHEEMGWLTFLRELWGYPDWSNADFYNSKKRDGKSIKRKAKEGWVTIEVSEPLPQIQVQASELNIIIKVGGVALGVTTIPVHKNRLTSQELRVHLTSEGNLELCRACVREAIIGKPFTSNDALRDRLVAATQENSSSPIAKDSVFKLGQRFALLGTEDSRRSILPVDAIDSLIELAGIAQASISPTSNPESITQVVYAPEWIDQKQYKQDEITTLQQPQTVVRENLNDRTYFEQLFASQPNPWKYNSEYEQVKYEQTLSLLPENNIQQALELACAEGHFTLQLAPRVDNLVAADISQIALDHTAQRCEKFSHIRYQQVDIAKDPIPGIFDLIVCSEVLYYMGSKADLAMVAQKMARALQPDGYLLMAHAHAVIDEPTKPGFNWNVPYGAKGISDIFSKVGILKLIKEIRTPIYRIQLFQRKPKLSFSWKHRPQIEIFDKQPTPLPDDVEIQILWEGGEPYADDPAEVIKTDNLPILMYHHILAEGSDSFKQWRVTPKEFETQLRYLKDVGYYSVTLETWIQAIAKKQPLPGKAICITFDDGYTNFYDHAWPLLKKYGFSATVFLVADRIGQQNDWDGSYGEQLSLMNWEQLKELHSDGVTFGSHTLSHRLLTLLSATEIVEEGARSRSILEAKLETSIRTLAYPYGDTDPAIAHLMSGCGYLAGVTCDAGLSTLKSPALLLPRQEVTGYDRLKEFITKLELSGQT